MESNKSILEGGPVQDRRGNLLIKELLAERLVFCIIFYQGINFSSGSVGCIDVCACVHFCGRCDGVYVKMEAKGGQHFLPIHVHVCFDAGIRPV